MIVARATCGSVNGRESGSFCLVLAVFVANCRPDGSSGLLKLFASGVIACNLKFKVELDGP
jgi:hypothetical protein